jgi:hypothetical protein
MPITSHNANQYLPQMPITSHNAHQDLPQMPSTSHNAHQYLTQMPITSHNAHQYLPPKCQLHHIMPISQTQLGATYHPSHDIMAIASKPSKLPTHHLVGSLHWLLIT